MSKQAFNVTRYYVVGVTIPVYAVSAEAALKALDDPDMDAHAMLLGNIEDQHDTLTVDWEANEPYPLHIEQLHLAPSELSESK